MRLILTYDDPREGRAARLVGDSANAGPGDGQRAGN
jgi:hypothetical protein